MSKRKTKPLEQRIDDARKDPAAEANGRATEPLVERVRRTAKAGEDWRKERKAELVDVAERRARCATEMNVLKAQYAAVKKDLDALDAALLAAVRDLDKPYPPKPARLYPDADSPEGESST